MSGSATTPIRLALADADRSKYHDAGLNFIFKYVTIDDASEPSTLDVWYIDTLVMYIGNVTQDVKKHNMIFKYNEPDTKFMFHGFIDDTTPVTTKADINAMFGHANGEVDKRAAFIFLQTCKFTYPMELLANYVDEKMSDINLVLSLDAGKITYSKPDHELYYMYNSKKSFVDYYETYKTDMQTNIFTPIFGELKTGETIDMNYFKTQVGDKIDESIRKAYGEQSVFNHVRVIATFSSTDVEITTTKMLLINVYGVAHGQNTVNTEGEVGTSS